MTADGRVLEARIRARGSHGLQVALLGLAIACTLGALLFALMRFVARDGAPEDERWMAEHLPHAAFSAVALFILAVIHRRRTAARLVVFLEPPTHRLVIEGRDGVSERGPFKLTRRYHFVRRRRDRTIEAVLGIQNDDKSIAYVSEWLDHAPSDWTEGEVDIGPAPAYMVISRPRLVDLANKLAGTAVGVIQDDDLEWLVASFNEKPGRKKKRRKRKRA